MSLVSSFYSAPTINRINSGVMTLTSLDHFAAAGTIAAGITTTTRRGLHVINPTVGGTLTNNVGVEIDAMTVGTTRIGIRNAAPYVATPSAAQTLAAGTAILANAEIVLINSSGNVTITAAPTIADGLSGQRLLIVNVDIADTITIQDQGTLANSNLRLSAATIALAPRDSIQVVYSTDVGDWIQIGQTNVI